MAAFEDAFEKPSVVFHPDPLRASSSSRTGSKDFGGDQAVGGGRFRTAFCQEQGWRFCIIGGLALQRWGEPRLTRDIDIGFSAEIRRARVDRPGRPRAGRSISG